MNYRGTIAYRSNLGSQIPEGFLHSVVNAWDFLRRQAEHDEASLEGSKTLPVNFHFMRGLSCMVDESANQIAETFLGDWVLMLDTDHIFGADAFYEMVTIFDEHHLDILVGFTQKRAAPYHPVIYRTDFDAFKDFETIFPNPIERQTLIPIDSSGCACLMVRRNVFDVIKKSGERPFDRRLKFNAPNMMVDGVPMYLNSIVYKDLPKDRYFYESFAEDSSFFWRAKLLGFKAWCAPWVKFHHLETRIVTESMIIPPLPREIPT